MEESSKGPEEEVSMEVEAVLSTTSDGEVSEVVFWSLLLALLPDVSGNLTLIVSGGVRGSFLLADSGSLILLIRRVGDWSWTD